MSSRVPQDLNELAKLFEERHSIYGRDYEHVGQVLMNLFPGGIVLDTAIKMRRFYMFVFLLSKLNRYAQCMARGTGHSDSLKDLAVYATMLNELDDAEHI